MADARLKPIPGSMVLLIEAPDGLLANLPTEDQLAILEILGKPVRLNKYDDVGRAELEFTDRDGIVHFIYVEPNKIQAA